MAATVTPSLVQQFASMKPADFGHTIEPKWQVAQRLVEANERLEARVAELERRLSRSSRNSSLPPSQDPPSVPRRPRGEGSDRKRGGQHGHEGRYRRLLPPEQVDEIVENWPDRCRSCTC